MVGYIAFQDGRINYDEFAAMMRKGAGKLEGRLNEVLRDYADQWCMEIFY